MCKERHKNKIHLIDAFKDRQEQLETSEFYSSSIGIRVGNGKNESPSVTELRLLNS